MVERVERCVRKYKDPNYGRAPFVYELYKFAREVAPKAKLMINEWNLPEFYTFLKNLEKVYKDDDEFNPKKEGEKRLSDLIDVIGIQSHLRTKIWPLGHVGHPDPNISMGIRDDFEYF